MWTLCSPFTRVWGHWHIITADPLATSLSLACTTPLHSMMIYVELCSAAHNLPCSPACPFCSCPPCAQQSCIECLPQPLCCLENLILLSLSLFLPILGQNLCTYFVRLKWCIGLELLLSAGLNIQAIFYWGPRFLLYCSLLQLLAVIIVNKMKREKGPVVRALA